MSWADHLRRHIREREQERLHVRCQIVEIKSDPLLTDTERKKALDDANKDAKRLDALIAGLVKAQDELSNA